VQHADDLAEARAGGSSVADRICATVSMQELSLVPLSFVTFPDRHGPVGVPHPAWQLTWLIWLVHRVALDDPELVELDLSGHTLPNPLDEPRIVPKLFRALRHNSHLEVLDLADCRLFGAEQAGLLAASLRENVALRVLNLNSNMLEPSDLQLVFEALSQNSVLEELRCSNQFSSGKVGREALQILGHAMKENRTLRKLGMDLTDPHWRSQMDRAITRNIELGRRARHSGEPRGCAQQHAVARLGARR